MPTRADPWLKRCHFYSRRACELRQTCAAERKTCRTPVCTVRHCFVMWGGWVGGWGGRVAAAVVGGGCGTGVPSELVVSELVAMAPGQRTGMN